MRSTLAFIAVALLMASVFASPATAQAPALRPVTAEEVLQAVDKSDADVVVLNMWATWCVPCVEEFPDLVRLDREKDNVEVIFVSADFEEALPQARTFLEEQGIEEQGIAGATFLKDQKDNAFVNTLHEEWSGALPATFIYDRDRNLARFWKKTTYKKLKARVAPLLTP